MNSKVRNIIFDMGNVIIRFEPDVFFDREGIENESDRKLLKEMIYDSDMWIQMDMGDLDAEHMAKIVEKTLPDHLKSHARNLICGWCDPIMVMDGMNELVFDVKKKGYKIYLLSNASAQQKTYWQDVECSVCFDGTVVSAFEHLMKPDERIYHLLLERYGLHADECLFIDDRPVNLETAAGLGMDTFLFERDVSSLREYIGL